VLFRTADVVTAYHLLNLRQDNLNVVCVENGIMTSKSEINLQNFYVYNSSFGQKDGEVSA
jgi:hypothetical protein